MAPAPFEYYAPASVEEALQHLADNGHDARPLAGGQSLIPMMNFRLVQPAVLVDLNEISELAYIRPAADGGLSIGAMTRQSHLEHDPLVARRAPLVSEAVPRIAYPEIRCHGTLGGSIAHADPAAELVATSVALDGRFRLASQRGTRWVPAEEFFVGLFTTVLAPDELLLEVALPAMPPRSGWSICEVTRDQRSSALVGVAAVVALDGEGCCDQCQLVYFGLGDRPVRAIQAALLLKGQVPRPEAIREAADVASRYDLDPRGGMGASADHQRHLAKLLGRRALAQAFDRAAGLPDEDDPAEMACGPRRQQQQLE